MIKKIFSVCNSKERTHKIVIILGIKIKFKFNKTYIELCKKYRKKIQEISENSSLSKIRVAFYVNDSKWKSQELFDKMCESDRYEPFVLVAKTTFPAGHFEETSDSGLINIYNSFKQKNMPVYLAYDIKKHSYISLKTFSPDIIFYSRPFAIPAIHSPKFVANFALTCYIPYFISNSSAKLEANRIFHNNLWRYYILNKNLKREYSDTMYNRGKNLKVTGYPFLDAYNNITISKNKYVIYAPHWSVGHDSLLNYATFEWSGLYMLEFAKAHPEITWVFKPHPALRNKLVQTEIMTVEEVEDYYREWDKIGIKYEGTDYLKLFIDSRALITDCGSFLAEYMPTKKPVILLRSQYASPYNSLAKKITKYYYKAHNLKELEMLLSDILLDGNDAVKDKRLKMLQDLHLITNATKNIMDDLNHSFNINVE